MANETDFVEEAARRVPVLDRVDALVAGGGPAGIAAALASAREGARTLLVERYGYLGGMITGAHVLAVLGAGDGKAAKVRGVVREIRERLDPLGGVVHLRCGDYRVDRELFKWQAVEMLLEAGCGLRLHTQACAPILEDGRVAGAFVESKNGRQAILAKTTIDATADADLAFRAGCACDDETHDVTLWISLTGVDTKKFEAFRAESPQACQEALDETARRNGGVALGKGRKLPGVDVGDAAALTRAEIRLRRECFEALVYLRQNLPGYENARIAETGWQLGVRQGRRVRGEYVFTVDDLRASRHFDDGIARMGAYLPDYGTSYAIEGLDYDVPYRSLVPERMDGILIAGRCVSCDYASCNTLRLIVPCFATGQAAGVAAALAARKGVAPRSVPIEELRAALRGQDVALE